MKEPIDNYQFVMNDNEDDVLDIFADDSDRWLDELTKDKSLSDLIDEKYSFGIENLKAETTVPNIAENAATETNIVIFEGQPDEVVPNFVENPCLSKEDFCRNYKIPKKNNARNVNGLNTNGVREIIKKLPRSEEFEKAKKARKERINEEFIKKKASRSIFRTDESPIEKETLHVSNKMIEEESENDMPVSGERAELISSEQIVIDSTPNQGIDPTVNEKLPADSSDTKDEVSVSENSTSTRKVTVLLPRLPERIIFEKTCIKNKRLRKGKKVSFSSELPRKTELYESFELQKVIKRQSTQRVEGECFSCAKRQNLSNEVMEYVLRLVSEKLKKNV